MRCTRTGESGPPEPADPDLDDDLAWDPGTDRT